MSQTVFPFAQAEAFGEMVARVRLQRRASVRWLAYRVGITPEAMAAIEAGTREPAPDTLREIVEALDLDHPEATAGLAREADPGVRPRRRGMR